MSIYTIQQGNHSASGLNFGIHSNGATVSKTVKFSLNCQYDLGNVNQADINKLYGFSVGLFQNNQYNSARLGWRWSVPKQKIELLAYVYVNGVRINEWDMDINLGSVYLNEAVYTNIKVINEGYLFYLGGESRLMARSGSGAGYNQYPYFGGDEVAPHTMTLELI